MYPTPIITLVSQWVMQCVKFNSLLLGMLDLLDAGRHLLLRASVDDHRLLGSQPSGGTHGIHGSVASTDHCYLLTHIYRGVALRIGSLHQVDTGEVLVARHDADQVLTRYVHEVGKTRTASHEDSPVALLPEIFLGDGFSNNAVGLEFHTHLTESFNLDVDDIIGKAKLRNAVTQHPSQLMQCFKDCHVVAELHHFTGKGQPGRTGAHHGDPDAVRGRCRRHGELSAHPFIVGCKPLQVTDGDRFFLQLQGVKALTLTLPFLWAYPSTYCRQRTGLLQRTGSLQEVTPLNVLDELGNVDLHRTSGDAGGIHTVETAV